MSSFMMPISQICLILGLMFLFFSCKSTQHSGCGPLQKFQVDTTYCNTYNLPVQEFSLQYPLGFEIETQKDFRSPNYVSFYKYDTDSILTASFAVGKYHGVSENSQNNNTATQLLGITQASLLGSLIAQFKVPEYLEITEVKMGNQAIMGSDYFTARLLLTARELYAGFKGRYRLQIVMRATTNTDNLGVLLIMIARDDTVIQHYDDFETKGCIAPILKTFQTNL